MDLPGDLPLLEVIRLVAAANAARLQRGAPDVADSGAQSHGRSAEQRLDALFGSGHRLAVYGTLAPGRPNYHIVEPLGGEWMDGLVEGDLTPVGWGAVLGYPAFRPRVGGDAVVVQVLTSPLLATAWPALDSFEGPDYQRILVPVFRYATGAKSSLGPAGDEVLHTPRVLYTVANIYAMADS